MAEQARTAPREPLALVSRHGILLAAGLLLAAAYYGALPIALLAAAIILLAGLGRAFAWASIWRVSYERSLSDRRAFPDEVIVARTRIENRKFLPAPYLEVVEQLPPGLLSPGAASSPRHSLSLLWYRRAEWRYELVGRRRGCYTLGGTVLRGGDPYGVAVRETAAGGADEVLVYPRLVPLAQIGPPARAIFDRQRPPRSLFEDPSRAAGLRDYRPGDPRNRVDWKATARQGSLQIKVYEPTTTPQALLVLAMDDYAEADCAEREELGEYAISVVATLAHEGAELGWSVGALANGRPPIALLPSAGRQQVMVILEGLARLQVECELPLSAMLAAERSQIPAGTTIIFVAAELSADLLLAANDLGRAGHAIAFVLVGDEMTVDSTAVDGWPVFVAARRGL